MFCRIVNNTIVDISSTWSFGCVAFEYPNEQVPEGKKLSGYTYEVISENRAKACPVYVDLTQAEHANQVRKAKEAEAVISFNDMTCKASVKTVTMLNAYIDMGVESVSWRFEEGFMELDQAGMGALKSLVVTKIQSLFEEEKSNAV